MTDTVRLVALSAGLSTPSSTRMLTDQLSRAAATALGRDGAEASMPTPSITMPSSDCCCTVIPTTFTPM